MAVGNKVVVAEFGKDKSIKEFWPFAEFKRLLIKEVINVGTPGKPDIVPLADHVVGEWHDVRFARSTHIDDFLDQQPLEFGKWPEFLDALILAKLRHHDLVANRHDREAPIELLNRVHDATYARQRRD